MGSGAEHAGNHAETKQDDQLGGLEESGRIVAGVAFSKFRYHVYFWQTEPRFQIRKVGRNLRRAATEPAEAPSSVFVKMH